MDGEREEKDIDLEEGSDHNDGGLLYEMWVTDQLGVIMTVLVLLANVDGDKGIACVGAEVVPCHEVVVSPFTVVLIV